mgnify:FL=1
MNRRNRRNDPFGLEDLLDSWMDMMSLAANIDNARQPVVAKPKHEGTMSYEDREKDIVFTIDMPGVSKKDIDIHIEEHSIKVSAENGEKRKYNYRRKFKPAVDPETAKATFTNGVLDITVEKIESKPTGRKVAIK